MQAASAPQTTTQRFTNDLGDFDEASAVSIVDRFHLHARTCNASKDCAEVADASTELIHAAVARVTAGSMPIDFVWNERYQASSQRILSAWQGLDSWDHMSQLNSDFAASCAGIADVAFESFRLSRKRGSTCESIFSYVWSSNTAAHMFTRAFHNISQALFEQQLLGIHAPLTALFSVAGEYITCTALPPLVNASPVVLPGVGSITQASCERLAAALFIPESHKSGIGVYRGVDCRFYVMDPVNAAQQFDASEVGLEPPMRGLLPLRALRAQLVNPKRDPETDVLLLPAAHAWSVGTIAVANTLLDTVEVQMARARHTNSTLPTAQDLIRTKIVARALRRHGVPTCMLYGVLQHLDELHLKVRRNPDLAKSGREIKERNEIQAKHTARALSPEKEQGGVIPEPAAAAPKSPDASAFINLRLIPSASAASSAAVPPNLQLAAVESGAEKSSPKRYARISAGPHKLVEDSLFLLGDAPNHVDHDSHTQEKLLSSAEPAAAANPQAVKSAVVGLRDVIQSAKADGRWSAMVNSDGRVGATPNDASPPKTTKVTSFAKAANAVVTKRSTLRTERQRRLQEEIVALRLAQEHESSVAKLNPNRKSKRAPAQPPQLPRVTHTVELPVPKMADLEAAVELHPTVNADALQICRTCVFFDMVTRAAKSAIRSEIAAVGHNTDRIVAQIKDTRVQIVNRIAKALQEGQPHLWRSVFRVLRLKFGAPSSYRPKVPDAALRALIAEQVTIDVGADFHPHTQRISDMPPTWLRSTTFAPPAPLQVVIDTDNLSAAAAMISVDWLGARSIDTKPENALRLHCILLRCAVVAFLIEIRFAKTAINELLADATSAASRDPYRRLFVSAIAAAVYGYLDNNAGLSSALKAQLGAVAQLSREQDAPVRAERERVAAQMLSDAGNRRAAAIVVNESIRSAVSTEPLTDLSFSSIHWRRSVALTSAGIALQQEDYARSALAECLRIFPKTHPVEGNRNALSRILLSIPVRSNTVMGLQDLEWIAESSFNFHRDHFGPDSDEATAALAIWFQIHHALHGDNGVNTELRAQMILALDADDRRLRERGKDRSVADPLLSSDEDHVDDIGHALPNDSMSTSPLIASRIKAALHRSRQLIANMAQRDALWRSYSGSFVHLVLEELASRVRMLVLQEEESRGIVIMDREAAARRTFLMWQEDVTRRHVCAWAALRERLSIAVDMFRERTALYESDDFRRLHVVEEYAHRVALIRHQHFIRREYFLPRLESLNRYVLQHTESRTRWTLQQEASATGLIQWQREERVLRYRWLMGVEARARRAIYGYAELSERRILFDVESKVRARTFQLMKFVRLECGLRGVEYEEAATRRQHWDALLACHRQIMYLRLVDLRSASLLDCLVEEENLARFAIENLAWYRSLQRDVLPYHELIARLGHIAEFHDEERFLVILQEDTLRGLTEHAELIEYERLAANANHAIRELKRTPRMRELEDAEMPSRAMIEESKQNECLELLQHSETLHRMTLIQISDQEREQHVRSLFAGIDRIHESELAEFNRLEQLFRGMLLSDEFAMFWDLFRINLDHWRRTVQRERTAFLLQLVMAEQAAHRCELMGTYQNGFMVILTSVAPQLIHETALHRERLLYRVWSTLTQLEIWNRIIILTDEDAERRSLLSDGVEGAHRKGIWAEEWQHRVQITQFSLISIKCATLQRSLVAMEVIQRTGALARFNVWTTNTVEPAHRLLIEACQNDVRTSIMNTMESVSASFFADAFYQLQSFHLHCIRRIAKEEHDAWHALGHRMKQIELLLESEVASRATVANLEMIAWEALHRNSVEHRLVLDHHILLRRTRFQRLLDVHRVDIMVLESSHRGWCRDIESNVRRAIVDTSACFISQLDARCQIALAEMEERSKLCQRLQCLTHASRVFDDANAEFAAEKIFRRLIQEREAASRRDIFIARETDVRRALEMQWYGFMVLYIWYPSINLLENYMRQRLAPTLLQMEEDVMRSALSAEQSSSILKVQRGFSSSLAALRIGERRVLETLEVEARQDIEFDESNEAIGLYSSLRQSTEILQPAIDLMYAASAAFTAAFDECGVATRTVAASFVALRLSVVEQAEMFQRQRLWLSAAIDFKESAAATLGSIMVDFEYRFLCIPQKQSLVLQEASEARSLMMHSELLDRVQLEARCELSGLRLIWDANCAVEVLRRNHLIRMEATSRLELQRTAMFHACLASKRETVRRRDLWIVVALNRCWAMSRSCVELTYMAQHALLLSATFVQLYLEDIEALHRWALVNYEGLKKKTLLCAMEISDRSVIETGLRRELEPTRIAHFEAWERWKLECDADACGDRILSAFAQELAAISAPLARQRGRDQTRSIVLRGTAAGESSLHAIDSKRRRQRQERTVSKQLFEPQQQQQQETSRVSLLGSLKSSLVRQSADHPPLVNQDIAAASRVTDARRNRSAIPIPRRIVDSDHEMPTATLHRQLTAAAAGSREAVPARRKPPHRLPPRNA